MDEGDPPKTVSQELDIIFVATPGPKFVRNDWTVWIEENTLILSEDIILPEVHDNIGSDENIVRIYCFIDDKGKNDSFCIIGVLIYFYLGEILTNMHHFSRFHKNLIIALVLIAELLKNFVLFSNENFFELNLFGLSL